MSAAPADEDEVALRDLADYDAAFGVDIDVTDIEIEVAS